jgi:hypothetical protein
MPSGTITWDMSKFSLYKAKEYVLANGAPSHERRDFACTHARRQNAFLRRSAHNVICGRKVHGEYSAQFASGSVPAEVLFC